MEMTSAFVPPEALACATAERWDYDALRCCVEQIVAVRCGAEAAIEAIDRRPCDDGSSYAADVVTVTLKGEQKFEVFVKYFGSSRYYKHEPRRQANREMRVYRDGLAGAGLGTAEYHGALCDESHGRYWLFLEHVRGVPLAYRDFECWIAAAGWLGRLHGYIADHADRIRMPDVLVTHDATFFRSTAHRALSAVASISGSLADRLAQVVCRYDSRMDVMANEPPTLVHGAFKPRHVLVDDTSEPHRLCPIDWELAAAGSNLYDLAFLAHGVDAPALDQLLDTYRREALAHGVSLPGQAQMRHIVDCFRLHRILKGLGRAAERGFPEQRIEKAIESGERLERLVC